MKRISIATIMTLFFYTTSFAQLKNVSGKTKQIETFLSEFEKVGFSGTVLVELNGNKVISKGYGYRNAELKEKNTPNTIFDIGSLTKQFTAAAILKLEMQGKLSTSDTITKYFQNVPVDKSTITIHDLLRHQSGLQSNVGEDYDPITETAFLDSLMISPLQFKIGSDFSYSNIGYSLLALIIEKVSGQTYEQYLYEKLWKPSGMEVTGYSRPNFNTVLIAMGYGKNYTIWGKPTDKKWNGNAPYYHLLGNGGILSTTEDMYKWHQSLMSENILSKVAKEKLYHPLIRANENSNAIYAYGWDVYMTNRNTFRVWHNGTNNIFYADFMRFIDENITLILMSNKTFRGTDQLNFEIAKIIFEKNYKPTIPKLDNETNQKFTQEIIEIILKNGLEEAKLKYNKRPSNTDVLEYLLIRKGYEQLSLNKFDEAIWIFTINSIANPNSFNAYDSLGEAYMNKGDKISAIKNYEKSLQLDPTNQNAEEMIKKMK
ncbi:MAG: serine hydrolase [Saprospiraceae bacterium]|nr:serine hydrolase [Saprospiraceae bacterium]